MSTRYYPNVPWDDNDISDVEFNNNHISPSYIHYNSIYGPAYNLIYRLIAGGYSLCAQDMRTLVVNEAYT